MNLIIFTLFEPAPLSMDKDAVQERDRCDFNKRISYEMASSDQTSRRVRVYAQNIYDAKLLMQVKNIFRNVYLIVGVCNNNETDLYEDVRHCRYVDEVSDNTPARTTEDFIVENKIDFVVCCKGDVINGLERTALRIEATVNGNVNWKAVNYKSNYKIPHPTATEVEVKMPKPTSCSAASDVAHESSIQPVTFDTQNNKNPIPYFLNETREKDRLRSLRRNKIQLSRKLRERSRSVSPRHTKRSTRNHYSLRISRSRSRSPSRSRHSRKMFRNNRVPTPTTQIITVPVPIPQYPYSTWHSHRRTDFNPYEAMFRMMQPSYNMPLPHLPNI